MGKHVPLKVKRSVSEKLKLLQMILTINNHDPAIALMVPYKCKAIGAVG
jgi:hypothetical protein